MPDLEPSKLSGPTNLRNEFELVTSHWTPRVVGKVNDQYVKVAKVLGELTWHSHDDEDELFLVISGRLRIEFESAADVHLGPGEFYVVPRGLRHNPVADSEVEIVLIETVTTLHTGSTESERSVSLKRQLEDFA